MAEGMSSLQEPVAQKRLAAIVAIDVAGYSARTAVDEAGSAAEIAALREQIAAACAIHGGRVFNTAGDGFMLEFPTVSGALEAADALAATAGPPIRIGVHLGEVRVTADGDLLGHGVNVAARLQALAPARQVFASGDVKRAIRGPLAARLVDRGVVKLDKMDETVRVYGLERAEAPPAAEVLRPAAPPSRFYLRRRALIGGGAVAALGAAGFAGYRLLEPKSSGDRVVAVLPFDNLSPDPQLGYFADGLSEDIVNALIRGGGVQVTSSASSFTFRGASKAKAGQALGADYLLDGSVLRDGDRLRVNAQFSRADNHQILWSDSFDQDVGEELQIEDEIAARVTAALKQRFMAAANTAAELVDPVAYDLYLRGRAATRIHTPESVHQGGLLLLQAVRRAPNFAGAWYELANYYSRAAFLEPVDQQLAGFQLGRQAARRALELDPRNGAAYGIIGELTPCFNHWSQIDAIHRRGLAISPNSDDLLLWRGNFLMEAGRLREALPFLHRAQALAPFELFQNHSVCLGLTYTRQFKDALVFADRLDAIWPGQLATFWDRFWLFVAWERWADAKAHVNDPKRPHDSSGEYAVFSRMLDAIAVGDAAAREAVRRDLMGLGQLGLGYASQVVILLAKLGFADDAVTVARSAYLDKGDYRINRSVQFVGHSRYPLFGEADPGFLFHPFLAPLRASGRLDAVFDGIGLTAFWRQVGPPDA